MTPVANSTSQRGQISIFFSASIVVLISIVAFVINVGLFVKAKINLQNSTDASAYAGAAVQARQLSKIAYLNWEMRNIYKEFLYKYYVIGNLNIADVENPTGGSDAMSYRLADDRNVITGSNTVDPYNIPAVCIHLANSKTNICKRYSIPGLPEFVSSNLPGAEEASRAFMDVLISSKVNDCIDRTRLNMLVATTWAYNVLTDDTLDNVLVKQGPAILANRQGAWPRAVELAMRMRNLELAVNRAPESGVCSASGSGTSACTKGVTDISQDRNLGSERIVKAFYSGYRNLGNEVDSEMKDSFTLTEIKPKAIEATNLNSASYLLVPKTAGTKATKYYLDLRLMMVNYAIFYAAMIPRADSNTSGACDVSKVAIPVPGYPLGYYKNPDVLTYYAVRGEANFSGMFNPFDKDTIKLTAYAAAKPFGGRIGPQLFIQTGSNNYFVARQTANKFRSVPYISTLELSSLPARGGRTLGLGEFLPGLPLPINFSGSPGYFWLKDESVPLGGSPSNGDVQFGIPNIVYDYKTPFNSSDYSSGSSTKIHRITPRSGADKSDDKPIGLFSKSQMAMFKGTALSNDITQDTLEGEIARVRAPTLYEAANYMIPSNNKLNMDNTLDSFGAISGRAIQKGSVSVHTTNMYAPLYSNDQADVYWNTSEQVVTTIFDFMRTQKSAVDKYRAALNMGAKAVYDMRNNVAAGAGGSKEGYEKAARGISDINFTAPGGAAGITSQSPGSCASLAGQFLFFYYGDSDFGGEPPVQNPAGCPATLGTQLKSFFKTTTKLSPTHYNFEYSVNPKGLQNGRANPKTLSIFTAYMPGPFSGVGMDGKFVNPLASSIQENTRRNFYSTKLIPLDSLQKGRQGFDQNATGFPMYSEGGVDAPSGNESTQQDFKNPLDAASSGVDLTGITY